MKKIFLFVIMYVTIISYSSAKAESITNNDIQLRDDLIFILFSPYIDKELEKRFGTPTQYYYCNILQIDKVDRGSYLFDVTIQVVTFEGAHNPPNNLVSLTFSNYSTPDWQIIDFNSRKLKQNEVVQCKKPL